MIADEAVRKVYEHGAGRERAQFEGERLELGRRFREKYKSDIEGQPNVAPYFIGVFDAVASLGAKGLLRFLLCSAFVLAAFLIAFVVASLAHLVFDVSVSSAFIASTTVIAGLAFWRGLRSTVKVIRDYPEPGNFRWHIAKWDMKFYDRALDRHVHFARHAISIDETRADFPRVPWGFKKTDRVPVPDEPEYLKQIWFAGNHSDVGGSYPEDQSRLSDISLKWMIDELRSMPIVPQIDSSKLNLFPSAAGMQHCEVDATRDWLASKLPRWWPNRWLYTWKEAKRADVLGAPVHESVVERFALPAIQKYGQMAPYRPESLRNDPRFSHYYQSI